MPRQILLAIALIATAGTGETSIAQPAAHGRLQEGPYSHHFDGSVNGPARPGEEARALRHARLTGRCLVEIDLFSGRPNPRRTLSLEESRFALGRLRSAEPVGHIAGRGAGVIGLGYRGTILSCETRPTTGPFLILCGDVFASRDPGSWPIAHAPGLESRLVASGGPGWRAAFRRAYDHSCGPPEGSKSPGRP